MKFLYKLNQIAKASHSLLCIGLDTDLKLIPELLLKTSDPLFEFNKRIIKTTSDLVCAYKPNLAFYEACGTAGWEALKKTIRFIPRNIVIILDGKRGDIGNTSKMYARALFDELKGDAVTLNPYLGQDSIAAFSDYKDKFGFILCLTSNPGAVDLQLLKVGKQYVYEKIARKVKNWNKNRNLGLVVGATFPEQLKKIRKIAPELPILIPGLGTQGGDLEKSVKYSLPDSKRIAIFNVSRTVIYASQDKDFDLRAREKALEIRNQINQFL